MIGSHHRPHSRWNHHHNDHHHHNRHRHHSPTSTPTTHPPPQQPQQPPRQPRQPPPTTTTTHHNHKIITTTMTSTTQRGQPRPLASFVSANRCWLCCHGCTTLHFSCDHRRHRRPPPTATARPDADAVRFCQERWHVCAAARRVS